MRTGIEIGFLLDERWHLQLGEPQRSKRADLVLLGAILDRCNVPYAIVGDLALQHHSLEPRTALAIEIALAAGKLPLADLAAAGFTHSATDWLGPDQTPVQFTDDPSLAPAIARAETIEIDNTPLRIIRPSDLLHEKLRAGSDPARRRSKRLQDLADAQALLEDHPTLESSLTPAELALLSLLPR